MNCGEVTMTCGVQGPQGIPGPPGAIGNVVTVTADQVLTASQNGTLFNNAGAQGEVDLTLPPASSPFVPVTFSLLVAAAQAFLFKLPSGVIMTNGDDESSAGGSISSNTVGNFLTVTMVSTTQWVVNAITGIWTFE